MVTPVSVSDAKQVDKPWLELPEVLLLAGIAALLSGVWMIYPPASLILFGLICIAAALNIYGYFARRTRENNGTSS